MPQNTQPKILLACIFLLAAILLGYFLLWPQYTQYQQKIKEIASKNQFALNSQQYYEKISQDYERLMQLNWPETKKKIETNFTSDVYFVPLAILFFQDKIKAYDNLYLSNIAFGSTTLLKTETKINEKGEEEKPTSAQANLISYQNLTLPLSKTEFSLSLFGSYDAFKEFLKGLENQAQITKVEEISFSAPSASSQNLSSEQKKTSPGSMSFSLRVSLFSQLKPK